MKDAGRDLLVALEAVDFTDAEGTSTGTPGSLALAGLSREDLACAPRRPRASRRRARTYVPDRGRRALGRQESRDVGRYVELHIEQEPVLHAAALRLTTMELPSGTGHDAQSLAAIASSGMPFMPSGGGVGHDPAERTSWENRGDGANVLLNVTIEPARSASG